MSEGIDTKNHPTVKALELHRVRLGLTDTALARRMKISSAAWSTLRSGTYGAQNPQRMLAICEAQLRVMEDEAELGHAPLLTLTDQRAVIAAVSLALNDERDRSIVYLGETGAGKTTLALLLREKYGQACVCAEASELWRDSYFAALRSIARALGLEVPATARAVQEAVLEDLGRSPRILVIDEAHYCGAAALNLVKLILNATRTRVVLLAIPKLWDQMCRTAAPEIAQLRNRTLAKVEMQGVGADDCRAFLRAKLGGYENLGAAEKQVVAAVCAAANRFGLLNTVRRICNEVNELEEGASLEAITGAIHRVEALRS